jgi:succinate dehydrogenase / fumarate reductase, flavoprotein subunit
MEFFQFHPTGLYKLGVLLSEARAARAASCATQTASASWSATPPRSRTWPRATWSAGHLPRGARGPRRGPDKDYVHLDLTHLGADSHRRQAARHHRVHPHLPRRRPDHRARADPADRALRHGRHPHRHRRPRCCRCDNDTVVPGLYAAGEVACVSARREPPRHQLAARHPRLRAPRRHATPPSTPPRPRRAARRPQDRARRAARDAAAEGPAPSGSPPSAASCRRRWTGTPQVYRDEPSLKQALVGSCRRAARSATPTDRCRTRAAVQHRPARGDRARLPARPRRGARRRRLGRKESRGGHYREDYPDRDDENFMQAHHGVPTEGLRRG